MQNKNQEGVKYFFHSMVSLETFLNLTCLSSLGAVLFGIYLHFVVLVRNI